MTKHQSARSGNFYTKLFTLFIIFVFLLAAIPMQLVQAKLVNETGSIVEPSVKLQTVESEWDYTTPMINARFQHKATLLNNGSVLVSGGTGGGAESELYDPLFKSWTATGLMNTDRRVHTSTLLTDGKVLVTGGLNEAALASAELYDPSTGTWVMTGALNNARYDHTATLLSDGKVLVTGGHNGTSPTASAEIYDPVSGTWTLTNSMAYARWVHTATLLPNGDVLIAGGAGDTGFLSSAELYDPDTGTWTSTPSMNTTHCYHSSTLLQNGLVLVAGDNSTGSAELYDPSSNTWTSTSPMHAARRNFGSALLPDGKVLVAGGDVGGSSTNAVEAFDPDSGTWLILSPMNEPRSLNVATALTDGRVLVTGTSVSTVEIFTPLPRTSAAKLIEVADSLGNSNINSWTNGTGGDWSCDPECADLVLNVGETITLTATATDPNGLPLEYFFAYKLSSNGSMVTLQDWSSDNTFDWSPNGDHVGPWIPIIIAVRNNDGQDWQGYFLGDDYTFAIYAVVEPAIITQVTDSLGNTNTNSWTKGTGGDWSCSPDCPDLNLEVGETVSFTATASDPNGLPLEYSFAYQPSGGSFITLQDWSSNNTFVWNITTDHLGQRIPVIIAVRNNDGEEWQGEGSGDDYTYATYTVTDPSLSPALLISVTDSLGNTNTNSWSKGTGGDWSCNPTCADLYVEVGQTVTLTATASDPNNLPLEFKFEYHRDHHFLTAQDWSSDNTFTWNITVSDVGKDNGISISVRNNDGQEWQGDGNGDDYTYATYTISDPSSTDIGVPQTEYDALVALYNATVGPNWINDGGWLEITSPCFWYGITCENGHVKNINLIWNNLVGTIPSKIGDLNNLEYLWLDGNELTGSLPSSIGSLVNLRSLSVSSNQITGIIPSAIGNLINLTDLELSSNQLTGILPIQLSGLTNLKTFSAQGNQLSGNIPAWLGSMTTLEVLILSSNQFSGTIPAGLGGMTSLVYLALGENELTGTIPVELANLTNLKTLHLYQNQLSGSIPPQLGNLTALEGLGLDGNHLTGIIPPELGNLSNLFQLELGWNELSGTIPPELGNLTALWSLGLSENQLSGNIPHELGNLANLEYLRLEQNQLTGNIPIEFGGLQNLISLSVNSNPLSGELPTELSGLTALLGFYFENTNLCGPDVASFQTWIEGIPYKSGATSCAAAYNPSITSLSPGFTAVGSSAFTIIITGTNFHESSVVKWDDIPLPTTYINSSQLSVNIGSSLVGELGQGSITVENLVSETLYKSNFKPFLIINVFPGYEQKLATSKVAFDWDEIPDANLYNIQLSLSSNFSSTVLNTTTSVSNYSFGTALTNGKTYYWRIRPRFGSTWSDWSPAWKFYSLNPPLAPVLTSPSNAALTNDNTPMLTWNTSTNSDYYQVQISKSSTFSPLEQDVILDQGLVTYTTDSLSEGTHYWRVRGIDSVGVNGAWSAYRSFTVDTLPQAIPAMVSPANGAAQLTTIPKLTAGTVSGAKYYQFQVDDTLEFIDPSLNARVTTAYYTLTSAQALPFGTAYWRVRSEDAAGNLSDWSSPRSFVVTILKTPANNSYTTNTKPVFSWAAAAGALQYHIQVDDSDLFDSPQMDVTRPISTSYTPLTSLPYGEYFWRMQVNTASGWGNWTPAFTFKVSPALPLAPGLKSPATAAFTNDNTPTLEWNAVATGDRYEIQISRATTFSILEQNSVLDPGLLTYTADTLPDGMHYWRVRAINYLNLPGTWSAYRSFTVDTLPQAIPAMVSPANGAAQLTTIPKLTVGTVSGAKYYQFQVDDTLEFIDPSLNARVTTAYYTLTSAQALPFGTAYWRVRSEDAAGNLSDWSSPRSFVVTILKTPANNSYTTNTKPVFSWAAAAGALQYHIQVDDSDLFDSPQMDVNRPISTSYTPLTSLPYGEYFWRMQVNTASGWGNWTPAFTFKVSPALPLAPGLKSPASAAFTNDNTPTLEWNAVATGDRYEIQVSRATTFSILEQNSVLDPGMLTYTADTLPDGMHYWRVRAINYLNLPGTWSAYRSFTVDTVAPGQPTLTTPAAGASLRGTPKYSWLAVSGAKYYQFEYSTDSAFSDVVYTSGELSTLYVTPPLQELGSYYWHVRAKDAAGNWGGWSPYRQITILPLLPAAPVLVSPNSGSSVSITTPTFNWNPVPYAIAYEIQVDNNSTFSSPEATGNVTTTWFTSGYLSNGTYYWRVRAKNVNLETGAWSLVRSVIVNVPANSTTTVVSVSSTGAFGNYGSGIAKISENGRFVVYSSMSSNLVSGDTNETDDVFVYDQQTNVTSRVSVSNTGAQANTSSLPGDISADGRFVFFTSSADNLVPGDTNNYADVFVRDRQLNQTTRISVSSSGTQGNNYSVSPLASADGRFVVFSSEASNLVSDDTNNVVDVFLHDRQTGQTTRISLSSSGVEGNGISSADSISRDGRFITFVSEATNLVSGDTNGKYDIFLHDTSTGITSLVSVASDGTLANDRSGHSSISGDGRYIVFESIATNLDNRYTTHYEEYEVYLHDTVTGVTSLVSVTSTGDKGNCSSTTPVISADGQYVAFVSCATNLVSSDTNGQLSDIFVHNLLTNENRLASINSLGGQGDRDSYYPSISGDGRYVTFDSDSWAFVNGDYLGLNDVFVHEFR